MKHKKGQILLITVMLLATIMTVLLSVTFQSTTEIQTTKLEEESQKALAAAEAAIEASLKSGGNVAFGSSTELSSLTGFTGGATISADASNTFTSPLIPKNSSYTFYLGAYDPASKNLENNTHNEDVTVCFNSTASTAAIEIALLKTTGIVRYVIDPDGRTDIGVGTPLTSGPSCVDGGFRHSYKITADTNSKLLVVRVLYASSKLYFSRGNDFPLQGKTITSEAKSTAGVSKKVVLFQSYPQIPAEFFTTRF